ncbi:MAG: aminotransferase class I/II-fold pyridoxal phosphate-dependent enzyme [Ardenticatenaceae bacterium]|nr:aminotransferase class I/II-fold pyridoxal phosphate-dependent enzyme [Ardenticatenaceae bacterium]MCB9443906.1 aminotransferase class I/II-fold pyridoxal phosphate-dependent enzyme [Ardenticatenaceae bacterium]
MGQIPFENLAVWGGQPAFNHPLHVGRPNLGSRAQFAAYIDAIWERRWLTNNGPLVQELEAALADFLGVKHLILVNNGTIALEIAARAADVTGEVIMPSMTFPATPHAFQWQGIKPIFGDITPYPHNLDPDKVEALITPRTTAVVGVHLWGIPCNIEKLEAIARRHHLRLLFDAAHAFGCSYNGRAIGNFGDAEIFSFHATKFFNSLEGGAIATNDDQLAAKAAAMRNFGFTGTDHVGFVGINGKMDETAAAMGLVSLASLDHFIDVNRRNYHTYQQELADLPGIRLLPFDESQRNNFQYIVAEINESEAGLSRDEMMRVLQAENVLVRRYFYPGCHRGEPYASTPGHTPLPLPVTEKVVDQALGFPTGTAVSPADIQQICQIIRLLVNMTPQQRQRLSQIV